MRSLWHDEKGNVSAARVFFAVWTVVVCVAAWRAPADPFWPMATSVLLGLLSWAAGPRIAQYLAPQISGAAKATADALKEKVLQRRQNSDTEPTA